MFLPAVTLVALLPSGLVDGESLLHAQHAAMVPIMLAVMLFRRSEYSQPIRRSTAGHRRSLLPCQAARAR